ncbi:MAG: NigD-like N-terminal domain-containing protein [Prevotella sp.]|nr:NigD-like N-terminal domain-containing protein [Prevotella sp.]
MTQTDCPCIRVPRAALLFAVATVFVLLLTACTTDAYEAGEGKYSHLMAEFGMGHTAAKGEIDHFTTDDGRNLVLTPHAKAGWATTPDSLYRALLYYYDEEKVTVPFSIAMVHVMNVAVPKAGEKLSKDPLTLTSAWMSGDGQWLNMRLDIKTGKADDPKAVHNVGLVRESMTDSDYTLRIVHSRNNIPEYFTSTAYVSVPIGNDMEGKTIIVKASTYDGEKTLTLEAK